MAAITQNYYCGIGSRDTPADICQQMTAIAQALSEQNYILRSGHADGADLAFERGAQGKAQIWLPWKGFNKSGEDEFDQTTHNTPMPNWMATKIASEFHPNWHACSEADKKMHVRNVYQVLGPGMGHVSKETMSKFVICWTPGGKAGGGTGQAIRIANGYRIPVFDLGKPTGWDELVEFGRDLL